LRTDQDAVGLDVPVKKLGRTLPELVSLADRHPFTAASANVDEAIAKTGHKLALNLARGPYDFASSVEIAALRHPAAHAGDNAHTAFPGGQGRQPRRDRHAQGCGMERKAVDDCAHLRMRLRGDSNNLWQREERLPVLMKFGLDLVRADVDEMPLPVPTDRAMLALHGIKQTLTLDVDLLARDRLERTARLHLGRNIDEPLARPLLQALANEFRQRFLSGREHENGGVRRLSQMPGRGGARALCAAGNLVNDRLRRARIGERNFVERQSQIGPSK